MNPKPGEPILINAAEIAVFTAKLPLIHGAVLRRSRRSLTLGIVCPFCGSEHRHRYPAHWARPAYRLARCARAAYLILPEPDVSSVGAGAADEQSRLETQRLVADQLAKLKVCTKEGQQ